MTSLKWTDGTTEWYGKRGNRIIAMIVLGQDGYETYDQRDAAVSSAPYTLSGLSQSLEEAQERTKGW